MALLDIPIKAVQGTVSHTEFNQIVAVINQSARSKAFRLTSAVHGTTVVHDFGLAPADYHYSIAVEDSTGVPLDGVTFDADSATMGNLIFDDTSLSLTAITIILTATPL